MHASPGSPGSDLAARPSLWPRIAAVLALLAPVVMVVVAAVALAGDVPVAVLAVGLVLVCSAAIWFALTRRGPRRAAGAALAALSGIGLIVVLVANWQGVVVLVALLLLLAVFGLAARYALGRTGETAVSGVAGAVVPVGAAGSAVLIINLKSGGGKAERFDLAAQARRRGIEPVVLQPGDDLLELAESAIARGAQVIGMAGGDGSQALVATVAARHDVAHVCIPAGTRNHFALDLGLDRDDVVGALDAFTDGVERRIDLARVNDRVFVNNASLGVYAKVVQSDAYRDAKLETWTGMLPDLLGPDAEPIDLEFTAPDGSRCDDAPLVLVSNNPYRLASLAGAGTRERIDTGRLGVVAARVRSAADVSKFVALELVGQVGRFPGLLSWSTQEFEVRSERPGGGWARRRGARARSTPALRVAARGAARAAAQGSRPATGRQSCGADHGQSGCAATGGGRPVSHPAARLVLGLAVFVLIGWGVGELWTSAVGSLELGAMREVAAQRTAALTDVGAGDHRGGQRVPAVPLALIACVGARTGGPASRGARGRDQPRRREADLGWVKLLVRRAAPARRAPAGGHAGSSVPSGHATQASAFWLSLVFVLPAAGASEADPRRWRRRAR